jgi:hypothetical protein
MTDGGSVEVADLGTALLIAAAGGLRAQLRNAIDEAGGYVKLVAQVADANWRIDATSSR